VIALSVYRKFNEVIWAAVLISLPFTSFPLFEKSFGVVVSPLAAGPLIILIAVWFVPYIVRRGKLPKENLPILVFCLASVAASALAFFINVPTFKGATILGQEIRALLTLALGVSFYLVFSSFPRDQENIANTLKWINIGGALLVLWTLTQAYFMFFNAEKYPVWYVQLQSLFSSKTLGLKWIASRLTGLAYESSWFSYQLMILYFPLWFAATIRRTSVFTARIFRLSIENILLAVGIGEFFLSSPRISLVSLFIVGVYFFGRFNLRLHRMMMQRLAGRWQFSPQWAYLARLCLALALGIVMVSFYLGVTVLGMYVIGQRDARVGLIFKNPLTPEEIKGLVTFDEAEYIHIGYQLAFGERIVYWVTGFNIFNDHPWAGVGLGNSGFFFLEKIPVAGYASTEIRALLNTSAGLPNIKSLWFRLLAETGLAGFSLFVAWLVLLWRSTRISALSKLEGIKIIALAGQFSLLAFIAEGFSIDSFAMPYLWVMAGLISAVGFFYRQEMLAGQPPAPSRS
jgi:hypothetical protein